MRHQPETLPEKTLLATEPQIIPTATMPRRRRSNIHHQYGRPPYLTRRRKRLLDQFAKMSTTLFDEPQQQQQQLQLDTVTPNGVVEATPNGEEPITADHAVVLTPVPGATPLDYVRGVAAVVGSDAVHGMFEDPRGLVKIYLRKRKHVQTIVLHGVQVRGRLLHADYLVPPATRVVLTHVDPIVPDKSVLCLLGCFGSFESPLIRQRISEEEGFSHIEGSTRVLYMRIDEDKTIPQKLPLVHDNYLHEIQVAVEPPPKMFRFSQQTP